MTDPEIERITLCIAQMAATLEAGDRAANAVTMRGIDDTCDYVDRARALYESAVANVAGPIPSQPDTKR